MNGNFQVLKPCDMNPEMIRAILSLGINSGTWKESDIEYYTTQLANPANINVVYCEEDRVLGHIMARPHNDVVEDYLESDPLITPSEVPMFYIDHLNVDEAVSGRSIGLRLILDLASEGNRRQTYMFSSHCRTINGFSNMVQRKFKDGVKVIRHIDSYEDCNKEPFDYMEIEFRTTR